MQLAFFVAAFCISVSLFPGETLGSHADEAKAKDVYERAKDLLKEASQKDVSDYFIKKLESLKDMLAQLQKKITNRLKGTEKEKVEAVVEKAEETIEKVEEQVEARRRRRRR